VKAYAPQDEKLHRIVEGLNAIQIATKLTHNWTLSTYITAPGRYSHSGTLEFQFDEFDGLDEHPEDGTAFSTGQESIMQLLRDFADWIYAQLEAEHDHLTSDEHLDERLREPDLKFDEDGETI
jgi:hypothetical protein